MLSSMRMRARVWSPRLPARARFVILAGQGRRPPPGQGPTFRAGADAVSVDAIVTDAKAVR